MMILLWFLATRRVRLIFSSGKGSIFITERIIGRVLFLLEECDLFDFATFAMTLLSHPFSADFNGYLLLVVHATVVFHSL